MCLLLIGNAAQAQTNREVNIGEPEFWVAKVEADREARPSEAEMEGVYYLLIDRQTHIEKEAKFFQCSYRITSHDGLQENADISVNFDPSHEQITFHKVNIVRQGVVQEQLHPAAIKVIQKEQQMDRHLYDNSLTAIIHLQDLRVDDIVEFSYTRKGFNPVYDGHYAEQFVFEYSIPYEKGHFRVVSPKDKIINLDYKNGAKPPSTSSSAHSRTFAWNFDKVSGLRSVNNTPSWYMPSFRVVLTDYESWDEVNKWAVKHYRHAPAEQRKLKETVGDYYLGESPQHTALKVIRFVQDEVRYLGFEDGMHSHQPHPPLQVFKQRYGDCKDKTMLLCALMACYGIEANPVLVNSSLRHTVSEGLPTLSAFDHVIAQIVLDGDTTYIDPTISNQGGAFGSIYFPNYDIGYVIHPTHGGLRDISQEAISKIEEENLFTLQKTGEGASLMVSTKYYGIEADIIRQQLSGTSQENLQESYIDYYRNMYPGARIEFPVKVLDDREENILHITEYYEIPEIWDTTGTVLTADFYPLALDEFSNVSMSTLGREAPYSLNYPTDYSHETTIRLPEFWNVIEEEIEIAEPEYSYKHSLRYADNEVRLAHSYQTLASYIPPEHIEKFVTDHQTIKDNLPFQLTYDMAYAVEEDAAATPAIVITILTLLLGIWLMLKLYKFDIKSPPLSANEVPQPIGGWLSFFAIGVCLTPLIVFYQVFFGGLFFNPEYWVAYLQAGNVVYSLFMTLQLIFNILLLLFSITFAILFFQRRNTVPKIVSLKYAAHFGLLMIIMVFGAYFVEEIEYTDRDWWDLVKVFIGGVIWIWYFSVSQRVSETFVGRRVRK